MPKILIIDIETKPGIGYFWRTFKENIAVEQIIEPGGMICFGAQWFGQNEVEFYSDWEHGHDEVVRQAHRLLSEADAVVTYNGNRFDLPKLTGEFLMAGLKPIRPPTSIDLYKTIQYKMGFISNRLVFVSDLLKIGHKVQHEGFMLWRKVMEGNVASQRKMERYCKMDVRLTGRLYRKIRGFITDHPHLGRVDAEACGACGSTNTKKDGVRRTREFIIQLHKCNSCGQYWSGKRTKVKRYALH